MVSAKRTILSPFTKEYRAQATHSGISQFLDCPSQGPPRNSKLDLKYENDRMIVIATSSVLSVAELVV